MEATNKITQIISSGQALFIPDLNGKTAISKADSTFKLFISLDFKEFGLGKPSYPTKKTQVVVREMTADGTLMQIFKDIDTDLDKSVLTVSQIIEFCSQHSGWLHPSGCATLFLTKKRKGLLQRAWEGTVKLFSDRKAAAEYFVIRVNMYVCAYDLSVYAYQLEYGSAWDGKNRHRVVSPQLLA